MAARQIILNVGFIKSHPIPVTSATIKRMGNINPVSEIGHQTDGLSLPEKLLKTNKIRKGIFIKNPKRIIFFLKCCMVFY